MHTEIRRGSLPALVGEPRSQLAVAVTHGPPAAAVQSLANPANSHQRTARRGHARSVPGSWSQRQDAAPSDPLPDPGHVPTTSSERQNQSSSLKQKETVFLHKRKR